MIRNTSLRILALFTGSFVLLYSCKTDKEEDPAPADPKQRFIGNWQCAEVSLRDGTSQPYTVHINDSVNDYILIENFYGIAFNKKAKGQVAGDDFTLPTGQNLSGKIIKSGSGHLENSSTIKMKYIIDDGDPHKDTCTATLTKQ